MAKRVKSEVNKSQEIRAYMASNPNARPQEVVEALAANGVVVTGPFVSTLKSNDKRKKKRHSRPGRPRSAAATTIGGGGVDIDSLVQAKKLVDQMGGIANARKALEVLAKILNEE